MVGFAPLSMGQLVDNYMLIINSPVTPFSRHLCGKDQQVWESCNRKSSELLSVLKCFSFLFFALLIALSKSAWKCLQFERFLKLFNM